MKKIILTVFAASSLLLYSTPSFALVSVSVGIPMSHSIGGYIYGVDDDNIVKRSYGNAADKTGGYFLGVGFLSFGLGIDSYTTKFKTGNCNGCWSTANDGGLKTNMTNLFYQLPVPVVNLIIGLGTGTTEYDCKTSDGKGCSAYYDKGSATQWYTSIGMPLIPLFDIHLSYRSVTAKNIKIKGTELKEDNSGSVTGIGLAFNF
jgi:hypothetical protein